MKGKYIMHKLLNTSDFEVRSREQSLNLNFLQNDLKKKDYLKYLLLKMQTDIRLRLIKHPLLKMESRIRLQDLRLHTGFRKFFINSPIIDHFKPP